MYKYLLVFPSIYIMHKEAVREYRFYGYKKEERKRRMGLLTFKGGIHPDDGKRFSKDQPIQILMPKGDLVYPLSQHIGAPANPVVQKGDRVLKGELIAEAGGLYLPQFTLLCPVLLKDWSSASALQEQKWSVSSLKTMESMRRQHTRRQNLWKR